MSPWPQPPTLLVVPRGELTDLPKSWDGQRVEWSPWQEKPWTTLEWHRPDDPCAACGSTTRPGVCTGRVQRDGKGPFRFHRFWAFRCPDCDHDQVFDSSTDQLWDLDITDYGPSGSNDAQDGTS